MEILDTNNDMIKYLKDIGVIIYFKYKILSLNSDKGTFIILISK